MKIVFLISLFAFSTLTYAADQYVCSTSEKSKPYDTFYITVIGKDATVNYQRNAFFGSEEFTSVQKMPGCSPAESAHQNGERLVIKCSDEGYIVLKIKSEIMPAILVFPGSRMGYVAETELELNCIRK